MNLSQIQICEDDAEIKRLLVDHGKQTHLVPREGYEGPFRGPFRNHVVWERDGTLYAVTHYHGFLLPTDNGYVAMKIPVAGSTHEELAEVVNMFIEHGQDESGPYYAGIVKDEVEVN